jgi:hypothetical protein
MKFVEYQAGSTSTLGTSMKKVVAQALAGEVVEVFLPEYRACTAGRTAERS